MTQCLQNIPIGLQPLKLIDLYLVFWLAQQHLLTVLGVLTSMCKTSAQLRLENRAGPASFGSHTAEANTRRPNLLGLATARVG